MGVAHANKLDRAARLGQHVPTRQPFGLAIADTNTNLGGKRRRWDAQESTPWTGSACTIEQPPPVSGQPAKRPCAWGSWVSPMSNGGAPTGWRPEHCIRDEAPAGVTRRDDLAAFETVAAGLVITDKAFKRLRWTLGRLVSRGRGDQIDLQDHSSATEGRVERVVELLREGWGGVLMTALQARQLRDVVSVDSAGLLAPVESDLDYVLCCRVVDWWNLRLSYPSDDSSASAAVDAYSVGRQPPTYPDAKCMVAEMVEHSAAVERRLSGVAPLCSPRWACAHAAEAAIKAAESSKRLRVRQVRVITKVPRLWIANG